ncbi:dsDNA nuclease domain-containing protein [uncultured Pseudomonas sp.]|uniref:dsDNA nuclease domain-containing protein n=1 Tax=uncultured Pseudomonas sp. TaxID=114707 RepID=UPI0025865F00|nr:dsDNA nuclease domain-containing protein [uncultured Pseudomonas sp.]
MLDTKRAREQNGRDSFSRYRAQVRSAAVASLSILEGGEVDRVYCDLHDDFVIRKKDKDGFSYIFYQVKTKAKQNHNWTINEIFGLSSKVKDQSKQDSKSIKESFVGKLLLHTVVFDSYCNSVIFQTNINSSDEVERLLSDIESGAFSNKFSQVLLERFNECFGEESSAYTPEEIKIRLAKLSFESDVSFLKEENNYFELIVKEKIFEFSEIELERAEFREILLRLLDLVERKSSGIIKTWDADSIEACAGIAIDDLLSILSISRDAYYSLLKGGDNSAVKSASMIQRALKASGADTSMVMYCSKCKTDWDLWFRNARHVVQELDLLSISERVSAILNHTVGIQGCLALNSLRLPIKKLLAELDDQGLKFDLTEDLLLGGVFSAFVKGRA